ncbi:hypothetical protein Pan241w_20660 [Gimesia alba]|uniref:Carboxypeptidase regulatory-like domain-containing protein n=1 Tax=Gimesia alba TaxID=2527973 RepID=A0A517RDQ6_9PLAN|nr:hypothetical protein [Gimesia alba]QDT41986.1 hypothetical protein Pan241w_20660 [Gimesia alba]
MSYKDTNIRRSYAFGISLICLFAVGCGGSVSSVTVYPASGLLTVNGEPATGAIIGLHPVNGDFDERGTRPAGKVDADGRFTFSCYDIDDGAPSGEYIVAIYWPQYPGRDDPGADRMGGKYADPKSSELRITISEGENTLKPIVLENVKVLKGS